MAEPKVDFIEKCLNPNASLPAGKCLWEYNSEHEPINNGWVFQGCNCSPGKCCKAPDAENVPDGTTRETDCIDCPPPPPVSTIPTSAGPPDAEPKKKS